MSKKQELVDYVVQKAKENKLVLMTIEGLVEVDIDEFISVNKIVTKAVDVAGVRVQQYEKVDFNVMPINDDTPLWVDDAIELMQEQLQLLAEIECLKEQINLLEEELLDVRARVKLFENRRIPNAKMAIRKIGQKLQDDERLTIATAKVVKTSKQGEARV